MSFVAHFRPRRLSDRPSIVLAVLGVVALAIVSCGPTISTFNAAAYDQATSLKVESLALIDEATEPYAEHAEAVEALQTELRKAHEFAKGRPNNKISTRQWKILISRDRELLGGFLRDWKEDSTVSPAFVEQKKEQIAEAFDTIIELESGKIKPEEVRGGS